MKVQDFSKSLTLLLLFLLLMVACTDDRRKIEEKKYAHYEKGMIFLDAGDNKSAVVELKNAIEIDPRFAEARYQMALTYVKLSQQANAIKELTKVVSIAPKNLDAQTKLAELLLLTNKRDAGRELIDKVLFNKPDNVNALLLLARLELKERNVSRAQEVLRKAIELEPDNGRLYVVNAELASFSGDIASAEASLLKSIELAPDNLTYHSNVLRFYMEQQMVEKAIYHLKTLTAENPGFALPYIQLATIYETIRRFDKAEESLKKLTRIDPGNYKTYLLLATFYRRHGNRVKALDYYSLAYEKSRSKQAATEIKSQRAHFLLETGKIDAANNEINKILAGDPEHKSAGLVKSRILIAEEQPQKAQDILTKLIIKNPQWSEALYFKAITHLNLGELSQARETAETAKKYDQKDTRPHVLLANILLLQGDAAAAEKEAADALAINKNNYDAALTLGKALLRQDKLQAALRNFEQMDVTYPEDSEVTYNIGLTLRIQNQNTAAIEKLERTLTLAPEHSPALKTLATILAETLGDDVAIARVKRQVSLHPTNADNLMLLGTLLKNNKVLSEALGVFKRISKNDSNAKQAGIHVIEILAKLGKSDEFMREYRLVMHKEPGNKTLQYHFARNLMVLGKPELAQELLKKIVDDDKHFPEREEATHLILTKQ